MNKKGKKIFWVDIPDPDKIKEGYYMNIETFNSKKAAIKYVQKYLGADKDGKIQLVTEGRDI